MNNIKQLGLATHKFQNAYGVFPPNWNWPAACVGARPRYPSSQNYEAPAPRRRPGTWAVHLFPYIEQGNLFALIQATGNTNYPPTPRPSRGRSSWGSSALPTQPQAITSSTQTRSTALKSVPIAVSAWHRTRRTCRLHPDPGSLITAMPNGTSNTSIFAERYSFCYANGFGSGDGTLDDSHQDNYYWLDWGYIQCGSGSEQQAVGYGWLTVYAETGGLLANGQPGPPNATDAGTRLFPGRLPRRRLR